MVVQSAESQRIAVLFVCLGNICRSPLAEAAFRQALRAHALAAEVDSAGTGDWHVGSAPDPRAQLTARRQGIDISGYRARQVCDADFQRFSHIVALDRNNLSALTAMKPVQCRARLSLLLDHVPGRSGQPVADPYYGDEQGFEVTWADVSAGAQALARQLAVAGQS